MRILLDTHIYIWCLNNDKKLSEQARHLITDAEVVYISAVSIWETTIKIQTGKLKANIDKLIHEVTASGFEELPLSAAHSLKLLTLPLHHRDPFDRMLIAQAMSEPLRFLTADKTLVGYSDLITLV